MRRSIIKPFLAISTILLSTLSMASAVPDMRKVYKWLKSQNLNEFGDDPGTMYMGGNPLFDESTGEMKDPYEYLVEKFPNKPWEDHTEG